MRRRGVGDAFLSLYFSNHNSFPPVPVNFRYPCSLQYQVEVQPPPRPPPEEDPEEPSPTPAAPVEPMPPSPVYLSPPVQTPTPAPAPEAKVAIFYRDGQSLDGCLIANSAKRAELRKLKKDKEKVGGGGGGGGKKPPPSIIDRFPRTQSGRL